MDIFNGQAIPSHCRRVMELLHLQSVSNEQTLCDVKFLCNRGKDAVYAHSTVLEMSTNVCDSGIAQMIRSAQIENGHRIVALGSVTPQGLKHMIQYIYTGRFKISTENVISLAKAAKALRMKTFEMKCWKFIHGEVDARMPKQTVAFVLFVTNSRKSTEHSGTRSAYNDFISRLFFITSDYYYNY